MPSQSMFSYPRNDLIAGTVVFLIALPLCLGIAIACGVPPISGLIAGIVGGVIVPVWSRFPLSVTRPAAGLTSIVLFEVQRLGGIAPFLTAVILSGFLQMLLGLLRTGKFSALVPAAVIKGMLAAIGVIIVIKQIPVAVGVSGSLTEVLSGAHLGAGLIALVSLGILYGWKKTPFGRFQFLPAALVVVVVGSVLASVFRDIPALALSEDLFVSVPLGGLEGLIQSVPRPDFSVILSAEVWIAALTIAVVASIETLLSVQAVDRLDPLKRHSPPDRELVAQGAANAMSGLLGGLPVTAVIVRSGANLAAGERQRLSALTHGVWLLVAVLFLAGLLNQIPLACLAAVLIQVGLNLAKPALFKGQLKLGWNQFFPFSITIAAVLGLDLLKGVIIGIVAGLIFVMRQNTQGSLVKTVDADGTIRLRFSRDATFLLKPQLMSELDELDDEAKVIIQGTGEYIDQDIKDALAGFLEDAHSRKIQVQLLDIDLGGAHAGGGH